VKEEDVCIMMNMNSYTIRINTDTIILLVLDVICYLLFI